MGSLFTLVPRSLHLSAMFPGVDTLPQWPLVIMVINDSPPFSMATEVTAPTADFRPAAQLLRPTQVNSPFLWSLQ